MDPEYFHRQACERVAFHLERAERFAARGKTLIEAERRAKAAKWQAEADYWHAEMMRPKTLFEKLAKEISDKMVEDFERIIIHGH